MIYINVYADEQGRWHYGMPTESYYLSQRLPNSLLGLLGQKMLKRRHVCRLRVSVLAGRTL